MEVTEKKPVQKSMVRDMTHGNVAVLLFTFAAPLFVANALQAIYNVVDMIVVGQVIGGTGMSAVSTGGNVLHLLTFLAMGFSSAGQVTIARDVGAGDMKAVRKVIGTMFSLMLSMAVVISVVCLLMRDTILTLVNTPSEAYAYTMDYTVICCLGLVFIYGYNIVSAIMRGMGDSKRPFIFVAMAALINIVLDVVFVAFMGMEVMGAALATVIGQGFSFIYALFYLYRHRDAFGFDFKPESFKPESATVSKLCSLGLPMALQSASVTISMTVVGAWINVYGVTASATAGIYSKIGMMVGIMVSAITTAAASMIGQNLGAKEYKRVPKIMYTGFAGALAVGIIVTILMLLIPERIFGLFTTDADVLAYASIIIGPCIVNFFGAPSRTFGFSIINGSGNSKLNFAVAIMDGLVGRIGLAYLLGFVFNMGTRGFWFGDACAGFMPFVVGGLYFISGRWKK